VAGLAGAPCSAAAATWGLCSNQVFVTASLPGWLLHNWCEVADWSCEAADWSCVAGWAGARADWSCVAGWAGVRVQTGAVWLELCGWVGWCEGADWSCVAGWAGARAVQVQLSNLAE
jgi:hypothetical protein